MGQLVNLFEVLFLYSADRGFGVKTDDHVIYLAWSGHAVLAVDNRGFKREFVENPRLFQRMRACHAVSHGR